LVKGGKKYCYSWKDVRSAFIDQRATFKAYGAGSWGKTVRRTFVLKMVDGNKFLFDVSRDFPDFRNGVQLEEDLKRYIDVNVRPVRKFSYVSGFALLLVLILVWLWLKKMGW